MTLRGLMLVAAAALLTAGANVLLRAGVLRFGEFSLAPESVINGLIGLAKQPLFVAGFAQIMQNGSSRN